MSNRYIFVAVFLFWSALAASLLQVQLVASPVHRLRVSAYRSVPVRATAVAQVTVGAITASYN